MKIKLKELREKSEFTQRHVADLIGITEGNYRKLENNHVKSINLSTIDFLCKLFQCKPNDILEVSND